MGIENGVPPEVLTWNAYARLGTWSPYCAEVEFVGILRVWMVAEDVLGKGFGRYNEQPLLCL